MRNRVLSGLTLFLLLLPNISASAQQKRLPSTPEERTKAVQFAHDLENNPLGPQAKDERRWLTLWLIEVPDISVSVCSDLLGPEIPSDKKHGTEIFTQLLFSEAAFIIENPDKAKDALAVHAAGVAGCLKVYETVLKEHPKDKSESLDAILARRDKGELQDYVRDALKNCTK